MPSASPRMRTRRERPGAGDKTRTKEDGMRLRTFGGTLLVIVLTLTRSAGP